jgi:hypothetical protein
VTARSPSLTKDHKLNKETLMKTCTSSLVELGTASEETRGMPNWPRLDGQTVFPNITKP